MRDFSSFSTINFSFSTDFKTTMTYDEAIRFLFEQLPMYQRSGAAAYKNNLNNTIEFDKWFGHPHRKFKSIHVAGTNGKGSVSHILASILQEAGYCTGLYTSPHLLDFRERIKINGQMISKDDVTSFVSVNKEIISRISPSFFEMTVAMAFEHFAKSYVDVAVVETGLGGRLDSTNIIMPELSIITNISFDHTALLGNTLNEIAAEKAGIIKQNIPVIIGEMQEEVFHQFSEKARMMNAPLSVASDIYKADIKSKHDEFQIIDVYKDKEILFEGIRLPLLGDYQKKNIQTVIAAVEQLRNAGFSIANEHITAGISKVIENTGLMGRWQVLSRNPLVICDTGHNEGGINEIVSQLGNMNYKKLHIVFGVVNDKDISGILNLLPRNAEYYFTKADIPRSLSAEILMEKASSFGLSGEIYPTVKNAIANAKKNADVNDLIFIVGSTFVVAEAL